MVYLYDMVRLDEEWEKHKASKTTPSQMFAEDIEKRGELKEDGSFVLKGINDEIKIGQINEGVMAQDFLNWSDNYKCYFVNIEKISDYFSNEFKCKTIATKNKDVLYYWDGKCYQATGRSFIKEKFESILKENAKNKPLIEVISKVERKNYIKSEKFNKIPINLIPLQNGVFNIETKKLEKHSPKNYFKTIIPLTYDPKKECPTFLKFLQESLYPEDIPVVQEWFGFNLYRAYLIKKAIICIGEKDTGKTVFLDTLIGFIGESNKTGLSLQKISSGSDFVKLSLKDKYSNIYDDLSSRDMNDGGNFKIATGGGYISAEEKFGDYQQFKNYAKHTLAGNKIPPVKDSDDLAYYSRWIVLRFDNVPEQKDLFLKEKILKENSGILNWAIDGLYRLLKNGQFSYMKSDKEIKRIMEMQGDPLIEFGNEVLEKSVGQITKEQMYELYCMWADKEDKPKLSKEQLGRRLNKKIKYLVPKTGAKERFWDNVSIKGFWVNEMKKLSSDGKNEQLTFNLDTIDTTINII